MCQRKRHDDLHCHQHNLLALRTVPAAKLPEDHLDTRFEAFLKDYGLGPGL